MDKRKFASDNP